MKYQQPKITRQGKSQHIRVWAYNAGCLSINIFVENDLFAPFFDPKPYRVRLAHVILPDQHEKVKAILQGFAWEEYIDWMICPYSHTEIGEYEVWFTCRSKAVYFKLVCDV